MWNAEYRVSLMRNLDISMENSEKLNALEQLGVSEERIIESESKIGARCSNEELQMKSPQVFGDLSPKALKYIHLLQSEISNAKEVS